MPVPTLPSMPGPRRARRASAVEPDGSRSCGRSSPDPGPSLRREDAGIRSAIDVPGCHDTIHDANRIRPHVDYRRGMAWRIA